MSSVSTSLHADLDALERDGHVVLPGVFTAAQVRQLLEGLESALASTAADDPAIRGTEGTVYAARNVLRLWPDVAQAWKQPALLRTVMAVLGEEFGLVRGLYFDKPPGNSWALPWHKDLTIAVKEPRGEGSQFTRPTCKAGVPHVEAPVEVLQKMLTARIHLDEVTNENGPLRVVSGSHHTGKTLRLDDGAIRTILVAAGDVLLMRPLMAHCSNRSAADTLRHRRILHLEFAADQNLPEGYQWYEFQPPVMTTSCDPVRAPGPHRFPGAGPNPHGVSNS